MRATRVNAAPAKAPLVMVVDHQRTAIMENASGAFRGKLRRKRWYVINNEGRAQRFRAYDPAYYDNKTIMLESWRWPHSPHVPPVENREVDRTHSLDHVIDAASLPPCRNLPALKTPSRDATFRIRGQKLARKPHVTAAVRRCAPRQRA